VVHSTLSNLRKGASVTPIIEKLLCVQDVDVRIVRMGRELADIPARKKEIEARLEGHHAAVAAARETMKSRQTEMRGLEGEIETYKAQIRKLREQQMQLKSNKEFKAMDLEIEVVQDRIRGVEEKILVLMESVESAQQDIRAAEEGLKREENALQGDLKLLAQRVAEVEAEIARLRTQRNALAAEVDPQWLRPYDRIFKNKLDLVVFPVANGICGGCHMKLPPYTIHAARKPSDVVVCDYCGKMLYTE
jgi:predicted  nucleic acid-binding Zn-ribbon protein